MCSACARKCSFPSVCCGQIARLDRAAALFSLIAQVRRPYSMPFPPSFLSNCMVYTECLKCRKTLKSTRGEHSHLQQCCFEDHLHRVGVPQQENAAPDCCSSGSKRSHATSVASNTCGEPINTQHQRTALRADAVGHQWWTRKHCTHCSRFGKVAHNVQHT